MNINQAKKYFQQHSDANLIIVPRRHKYMMQIHHGKIIKTIYSRLTRSDIACESLEKINDYAKKLNKFDYSLIQNCPHVEMSGLDKENEPVSIRSDITSIKI